MGSPITWIVQCKMTYEARYELRTRNYRMVAACSRYGFIRFYLLVQIDDGRRHREDTNWYEKNPIGSVELSPLSVILAPLRRKSWECFDALSIPDSFFWKVIV